MARDSIMPSSSVSDFAGLAPPLNRNFRMACALGRTARRKLLYYIEMLGLGVGPVGPVRTRLDAKRGA